MFLTGSAYLRPNELQYAKCCGKMQCEAYPHFAANDTLAPLLYGVAPALPNNVKRRFVYQTWFVTCREHDDLGHRAFTPGPPKRIIWPACVYHRIRSTFPSQNWMGHMAAAPPVLPFPMPPTDGWCASFCRLVSSRFLGFCPVTHQYARIQDPPPPPPPPSSQSSTGCAVLTCDSGGRSKAMAKRRAVANLTPEQLFGLEFRAGFPAICSNCYYKILVKGPKQKKRKRAPHQENPSLKQHNLVVPRGLSLEADFAEWVEVYCALKCGQIQEDPFKILALIPVDGCYGVMKPYKKLGMWGVGVRLHLQCQDPSCHRRITIRNKPYHRLKMEHLRDVTDLRVARGFSEENVLDVLASLLSNQTYHGYERQNALHGRHSVSKRSYYKMGDLIWEAVEKVARDLMAREVAVVRARGILRLALDMGWAHRGWIASQGWYPVVDFDTHKILHLFVMMKRRDRDGKPVFLGNYFGTSGGMESRAIRETLDWLERENLFWKERVQTSLQSLSAPDFIERSRRPTAGMLGTPLSAPASSLSQLLLVGTRASPTLAAPPSAPPPPPETSPPFLRKSDRPKAARPRRFRVVKSDEDSPDTSFKPDSSDEDKKYDADALGLTADLDDRITVLRFHVGSSALL